MNEAYSYGWWAVTLRWVSSVSVESDVTRSDLLYMARDKNSKQKRTKKERDLDQKKNNEKERDKNTKLLVERMFGIGYSYK